MYGCFGIGIDDKQVGKEYSSMYCKYGSNLQYNLIIDNTIQ